MQYEVNGKAVIYDAASLQRLEFHNRGLMRYPFLGCFLGANVAIEYLSVRVCLGGEAVQLPKIVRTMHPRPLGRQVVCLQLRFSVVVWAVWVGTSWGGSPMFDH